MGGRAGGGDFFGVRCAIAKKTLSVVYVRDPIFFPRREIL
jgi:hypothetical protein